MIYQCQEMTTWKWDIWKFSIWMEKSINTSLANFTARQNLFPKIMCLVYTFKLNSLSIPEGEIRLEHDGEQLTLSSHYFKLLWSDQVVNCHALCVNLLVSIHFLKKTSSLDLSSAGEVIFRGTDSKLPQFERQGENFSISNLNHFFIQWII